MSLPRSLLEHDAMIYPTIFLYWHKTDLMIPKRDTKIAKSDIQGWINVTDYRKSSLEKCDISVIFCWLEWAEVINIFPSHHNKRRLEVHISIFLYFTTIWSGPAARREEFYLWWQGGPWCTEHLTSVRMAAELLQRFIFSSDYPPPGLCSFFGEKSWGEKVNVNNRFRLDSNLKQV